jgi:hypothetical protein
MIIQRYINIKSKYNASVFEMINRNALSTDTLMLGSTIKATNLMCSNNAELRVLLPSILGLSPDHVDWQKECLSYFNNFFLEIPFNPNEKINSLSLRLDTSYNFNLDDDSKKEVILKYLDIIPKRSDEYNPEEWVALCINGTLGNGKYKIKEEDLYKYVTFVNIEDYIKYRYCLLHNKVANNIDDIDKSVHIQFYLSSEEQEQKVKVAKVKVKNDAFKYYVDLMSGDIDVIDSVIINAGLISSHEEFKNLKLADKQELLQKLVTDNPNKLLYYKSDKTLQERATITKFIWLGLLKYISGTQTVVDVSDATKIIGNNMDECVSYFNNEVNNIYKAEIVARYKSLTLK